MLWPRTLANLIVVVHAVYVAFVVFGLLAILVGAARGWKWVRNPIFRVAHISAIGFVVAEALIGMDCPLTVWEERLRRMAGQKSYSGDFLAYWAHRLMFFEGPTWVVTLAQCVFGGAVLAAFLFAPPRWRSGSKEAPSA
jgi:hypothetical protein